MMFSSLRVDQIKQRYEEILDRIMLAAKRAGRNSEKINVILVTKTHPVEVVESAVEAGINQFGENYAEEALVKMNRLKDKGQLAWHMIGHVQSRKAQIVSQHFEMVHSVDTMKIAARLNRFAAEENRILPVFLECNTSGESSKFGWPIDQQVNWDSVRNEFEEIFDCSNLKVLGLMTMAPYSENPDDSRPYFKHLRNFRAYLAKKYPETNLSELSIGMSGDFEVAVEEGATYVRIGRAILGERL